MFKKKSADASASLVTAGVDANAGATARPSALFPAPSFTPGAELTLLSRLYNILALSPLLTLTLIFLLQTVFTLDARALWYSDEIRHADVLRNMLEGGDWFNLFLNGQFYPDKPPLYFWFLAGIQHLLPLMGLNVQEAAPTVIFIGVAASGLLFLWATLALARFAAGVDRRERLAAGLVLLSTLFVAGLFHYGRMDLLFSALITVSFTLLCRALRKEVSWPLSLAGFLCAGLAVLAKGPLGLLLPLLAAVLYALWIGRARRLLRRDFLAGIVLALIPTAVWLGVLCWQHGHDFIKDMLNSQVFRRAQDAKTHHAGPWFAYLTSLPLIWLPWTLTLFFLPWHRLFTPGALRILKDSRFGARRGLAFLCLSVLGGVVALSCISIKLPIYLLPLLPPLAVLTGRAVLRLEGWRARGFQWLAGIFLIFVAVVFLLVPLFSAGELSFLGLSPQKFGIPAWGLDAQGTLILCGIALVGGCLLLGAVHRRRPEGLLLTLALVITALVYPMAVITAPSLDPVLSPERQAGVMRKYMDQGYTPMTFALYQGTYSYYTRGVQLEIPNRWERLNAALGLADKAIIAMPRKRYEFLNQTLAYKKAVLEAQPEGQEKVWGDIPAYFRDFCINNLLTPATQALGDLPADLELREVDRGWIAETETLLLTYEKPAPAVVPPLAPTIPPAAEEVRNEENKADESGLTLKKPDPVLEKEQLETVPAQPEPKLEQERQDLIRPEAPPAAP